MPASARRSAVPAAFRPGCACGGGCPGCRGAATVQAKLRVSAPGDVFEREADRVAAEVLNGPAVALAAPEVSMLAASARPLQRISDVESPRADEVSHGGVDGEGLLEEEGAALQRLKLTGPVAGSPPTRGQRFERTLAHATAGGQALDSTRRAFMQARFQRDFGAVRVHDDARSHDLASEIRARAFTAGAHVFFNRGEYRPGTPSGDEVLAHELTHVAQQGMAPRVNGGEAAPEVREESRPRSADAPLRRLPTLGPGDTAVATGVQPWGPPAPIGRNYHAQTNGGRQVTVWVAYSPYANRLRYWCHGFSLGTYDNDVFGYSVYSGTDMKTAVADEYDPVSPAAARPGDIAVWNKYQHSAKFTRVARSAGGLDETASRLDSKNGNAPLANYSLRQLVDVPPYGPGYGLYRRKP